MFYAHARRRSIGVNKTDTKAFRCGQTAAMERDEQRAESRQFDSIPSQPCIHVFGYSPPQVLKLHEMNVEIDRPRLLAARRLGEALQQRKASVLAEATAPKAAEAAHGLTVLGKDNPLAEVPTREALEEGRPPLGSASSGTGDQNGAQRGRGRKPAHYQAKFCKNRTNRRSRAIFVRQQTEKKSFPNLE